MISVCVPVFNSHIDDLVKALHYQKVKLKYQVEILVIDDASGEEYRLHNRELSKYIDNYIELDKNIGRSRIRNLFAKYASGQYLLFIDSDSVVDSSDFLRDYFHVLKLNEGKVVVGGSAYSGVKPEKSKMLRWEYGRKVESRPASIRNKDPYRSFITKNVLIPLKVFDKVRFDETLTGYGHEDTLMGYRLKKAGAGILHIDNYVINRELDTNEEFLTKSREAVESLFTILNIVNGAPDFIDDVKLLIWVRKLYKMKLVEPVKGVLNIFNPFIEYALRNGVSSLFLFSLFKLHHALEICAGTKAEKYFRN